MTNILVVNSNSYSHDDFDLEEAINSIKDLLTKRDDSFFIDKGFSNTEEFRQKFRKLSGILFRSSWISVDRTEKRNYLWVNEDAINEIPQEISDYLVQMDCPIKFY
jgi:hypothetical protein